MTTPATRLLDPLVEAADLRTLLRAVAAWAVDSVPGCGWASITVIHDGRPATVVSSDDRASAVDEIQYSSGVGPCLQAARTETPQHVDDVTEGSEYEAWRQAAVDAGIRTTMSRPIVSTANVAAALNLYGPLPGGWPPEAPAAAHEVAASAGKALTLAHRLKGHADFDDELDLAIATHAEAWSAKQRREDAGGQKAV